MAIKVGITIKIRLNTNLNIPSLVDNKSAVKIHRTFQRN
ncbi:hypothetical protein BV140_1375 [Haemophilus influenzae]|nr:hypothetical protein HifGL_001442 [Haemophilus influenzae KR494]AIB46085.1 hypothetical protein H733_1268 [Haemophilus influenzae CGSHiCZ412602]AVI96355.1 hypothetical protein BV083_1317 [Haemophilus influenzae]AVI98127.1 hypothetical protein BV085_1314 [Haemophilus influenzae]AVI99904.1 hypothetical protein BV121_1311 [Haemophilus influenzae]